MNKAIKLDFWASVAQCNSTNAEFDWEEYLAAEKIKGEINAAKYEAEQAKNKETLEANLDAAIKSCGKAYTPSEVSLIKTLFGVLCEYERTVFGEWDLEQGEELSGREEAYKIMKEAGLKTWTHTHSETECALIDLTKV